MTLVVDWFVHVYKTFDFRNKKADLRIFRDIKVSWGLVNEPNILGL